MSLSMRSLLAVSAALWIAGCQTSKIDDRNRADQWGPARNGLRVQLWEIPNTLANGYLKLLSLALENVSDQPIRYDDQHVGCNDALIVKRDGVCPIPFRGEIVSTVGEVKTIAPGNIAPLFYGLILEQQYDIGRPGVYTVQFRGRTGYGEAAAIPPSNVITIRMKR